MAANSSDNRAIDYSKPAPRHRQSEMVERFAPHQYRFTALQWHAVTLHYGEGLTQSELARRLRRSRSSVSSLLSRAKEVMKAIDREMRREQFELARKHSISD